MINILSSRVLYNRFCMLKLSRLDRLAPRSVHHPQVERSGIIKDKINWAPPVFRVLVRDEKSGHTWSLPFIYERELCVVRQVAGGGGHGNPGLSRVPTNASFTKPHLRPLTGMFHAVVLHTRLPREGKRRLEALECACPAASRARRLRTYGRTSVCVAPISGFILPVKGLFNVYPASALR